MPERAVAAELSRRQALRGLAATSAGAAGALALVACSDPGAGIRSGGDQAGSTPGLAEPLRFAAAEVPLAGGVVLPAEQLVLTQPAAGEFHAFTAICTHQGCPVSRVEQRGIFCPCHSSIFDAVSGEPIAGPATEPLYEYPLQLDGDALLVG